MILVKLVAISYISWKSLIDLSHQPIALEHTLCAKRSCCELTVAVGRNLVTADAERAEARALCVNARCIMS